MRLRGCIRTGGVLIAVLGAIFLLLVFCFMHGLRAPVFRDVPFTVAVERLSKALSSKSHIETSDGLGAEMKLETLTVTLIRFSVSEVELTAFIDAGQMTNTPNEQLTRDSVYRRFREYPTNGPAWFREWQATSPFIGGAAYGQKYELVFLGVKNDKGKMAMFAELVTWSESKPDSSPLGSYVFYNELGKAE